jgi:benzylsuccinate CoA-transferase BbsF subunit
MAEGVFKGLKIADFSWAGVGPITAKYFADYGAQVIRIESATHPDTLRVTGPYAADRPGINRSGYYANFNSSKYGAALNMSHPKARDVALKFVKWADVLLESFTPRMMRKWRLTYEEVREVNPGIIMMGMPLFGQTGPHSEFLGFGYILQAASGINEITGWPDGEPVGTGVAYTDFFACHFSAIALLAALEHRMRTGEGQYIDFSQQEASMNCLGTALLDYRVNGRVQTRCGNVLMAGKEQVASPHGAYQCRGNDRWCVIAVFCDAEWQSLCEVIGDPSLASDERFATHSGRAEYSEEIDRLISRWTMEHEAQEVMHKLQSAGVAAGAVQSTANLRADPQLTYREHYWRLNHPEMGRCSYDGWSFRMSKTPYDLSRPAPMLGEHNEYVYKDLLGLSDEEYAELAAAGVLR